MVLHYTYKNRSYIFEAQWTGQEGKSTIFREIVSRLETIHGSIFATSQDQAQQLDLAVDKLYEQIYHFGDEYQAIPYDPRHRKRNGWKPHRKALYPANLNRC